MSYNEGDKQRRPGIDQADAVVTIFWRCYVDEECVFRERFMAEMEGKFAFMKRKNFRKLDCHALILQDLCDFVYYDPESDCYGPYIRSPEISRDLIRYRSGQFLNIVQAIQPTQDRVKRKLDKTRRKTVIHGDHCIPDPHKLRQMR